MHCYRAFGLNIESTLPIPELVEVPCMDQTAIDVTVWIGEKPTIDETPEPYFSPLDGSPDDCERKLFRFNKSGMLWFAFADGTHFYIAPQGRQIWTVWAAPFTVEDMATYLLGPILGYVLRLRNIVVLHASSVVVNNAAVTFVGEAGAGKSTTAASFALRGHTVLADDVSAIQCLDGQFQIRPSYPHLRLWPESTEALLGSADALHPITLNWDKRDFPLLDRHSFAAEPLELRAIYLLGPRLDNVQAPFVEPLSVQAALISLVGNTYGNMLLTPEMRQHEFHVLSQLVRTIPIRKFTRRSSLEDLELNCQVIEQDLLRHTNN